MEATKISWEDLKEYLPERTSLYYVDYRDGLDDNLEELDQAIKQASYEPIDELIFDWDVWPSVEYYIDQIKSDLSKDFEDEEVEQIMEEYDDKIRDWIYEKDDSTPLKDMLRNTRKRAILYDTGHEVDSNSFAWTEEEMQEEIDGIKSALNITGDTHDKAIKGMLYNAGYGGNLVVYFTPDWSDIITKEGNVITFTNAWIAVIDTFNGSGWYCELPKSEFSLRFDREMLTICRLVKYSFTHQVCGMDDDWCESTGFEIRTVDGVDVESSKSAITTLMEKDKGYEKAYKEGKCTFGDMDIRRHRGVTYSNDYPCGNRCPSCGTFWID